MTVMATATEPSTARPDFAELSIAIVGGLALALIAMFLVVAPLAGNVTGARDYAVFWATGQQLVHHADPYDSAQMGSIERAAGLPAGYGILYMRNPPWGLVLAWPLGLVGVRTGALLWSLALLACLMGSGWLIWKINGKPSNRIHWLAFSFAPCLICFFMGQTALLSLLGLVLFLQFHRSQPFAAGLALWLCALKPHLFVPFGVVLLVWVVVSRNYKILVGGATAMGASCVITSLMDPMAWSGYSRVMSAPNIQTEFVPCLSAAMRLWFVPQAVWLQYVPVGLACIWAVAYYWRRRDAWDWHVDGALVMLIGIIAAPYCWLYDQTLAVPALLQGAYSTRSKVLPAILALINIPILILLTCGFKVISPIFVAAAPVWLTWYLLARATVRPQETALETHDR